MSSAEQFDLTGFLPYVLTQAADRLSLKFKQSYKGKYGMLRTEWRVLFHLGSFGEMTATQICDRAGLHKTKVSRAVTALEQKRYLTRKELQTDRRHAQLRLTNLGEKVFIDLRQDAFAFDQQISQSLSPKQIEILHQCLTQFLKE